MELTVALHHVFDTPEDILIWDVGHQAYPHKILTGRRDQMTALRQANGPSGFTPNAVKARMIPLVPPMPQPLFRRG